MKRLTRRQQEVLEFIQRWIDDKHYPPSVREIATHFSLRSASGVHKHIKALVRKNFIAKDAFLSRSIRVLGSAPAGSPGARAPAAVLRIPVRSVLAAGGSEIGLAVGTPPLTVAAAKIPTPQDAFAVQVGGGHLASEGLFDGDTAVVMPHATPADGQVVLATLRGVQTVIRRYVREAAGRIRLEAPQGGAPPVVLPEGDVRIRGVVAGVWRPYA